MKKGLVLFLAIFGIFYFPSITWAKGVMDWPIVSMEYNIMANKSNNYEFNALVIDLEKNFVDRDFDLVLSISFDLSHEPKLDNVIEEDSFGYLLYISSSPFVEMKNYSLTCCAGTFVYIHSLEDINIENKEEYYSVVIGLQGTADFKPIRTSMLFLYGIFNKLTQFYNENEINNTNEVSSFYFESTSTYQINDSLAVFARYRNINYFMESNKVNLNGFGLGMEYRF